MTFPRSRLFQAIFLLLACGVMAAPPLVNHFNRTHPWPRYASPDAFSVEAQSRGNKDYPLWYDYGRILVENPTQRYPDGEPLYPTDPNEVFRFMYPPFAAVCLGALSLLGPTGMLVALILLNVASLAVVVELSVRMAAGTADVSPWLRIVPAAVCIFFVNDMFLLGQPNLGLLALILGGLMLARAGRGWSAGALFAAAAALKAFPAVILIYLIWRRYWTAAISMVLCGLALLVLVPGAVRGFERNAAELRTWANGMLLRNGENGQGQRPEQSVGWGNQSVFGLGNRLFRPGDAMARETAAGETTQPLHVNFVDLGYRGATLATLGCAALLGLGFIAVMPKRADRTCGTDAAEFGMLVILMTVGTPYAFSYYFVWLLYPLTVVLWHALSTSNPAARRTGWGVIVGVLALFAASAPVWGNVYPMVFGSLFWAAMVALGGCVWAMRRARLVTPPPPTSAA